jgi:hypothetical protein
MVFSKEMGLYQLLLWPCLVFLFSHVSVALERCSSSTHGGFCPSRNTCCRPADESWIQDSAGCLPSDLGPYNATCCSDGLTGCGVDYECGPDATCVALPGNTDPLVQTLPRYQLCHAPNMQVIFGLGEDDIRSAYYSSLGKLEALTRDSPIREVIFVVHGAARNADDYFCTMHSVVEKQSTFSKDEVFVVAPRFAAHSDEPFALRNGGIPMRWKGGSWRYGAESGNGVSSFTVLDQMIGLVEDKEIFPALEHIKVIGHSAGGQYVQRWALLTNAWPNDISLQVIVVNPSSFAYLTPLRKSAELEWTIPNKSECPEYNEWEWGLEPNESSPAYVQNALNIRTTDQLTQRFAMRDVVYLAGGRDICNVPGNSKNGWCYSHGLETKCMDLLEGKNRLERHMNYFESIQLVNVTAHRRSLVPDVGHDHSLVFHSEVAMSYLFETTQTEDLLSEQ